MFELIMFPLSIRANAAVALKLVISIGLLHLQQVLV